MLRFQAITTRIIGAAIEVHKELGPGLLESVYEECIARQMSRDALAFERQPLLPIQFRGELLPGHYRPDFIVEDAVVLELKVVARVEAVHRAQLLSYLKLSGKPVGLLLNFNVATLKQGITRMVNGWG